MSLQTIVLYVIKPHGLQVNMSQMSCRYNSIASAGCGRIKMDDKGILVQNLKNQIIILGDDTPLYLEKCVIPP